ncbi:MAG: HIT family protein [Candidatus Marsarchaeota archaeon]|nr:HIT family protein [Candidatus Marsarchaeota archaeon]MCL5102136.1 HIT family protein [Candidatus Marsarchaeota archaeon]
MGCVFCDLASDSSKHIYKDEICYVVLDINPVTEGHMLVITNKHYENMLEVPREELGGIYSVAQSFGKDVIEKLKAKGVNIGTNVGEYAGQVVMHTHVHIIPRYAKGYSKRHSLGADEEMRLLNLLKKGSL